MRRPEHWSVNGKKKIKFTDPGPEEALNICSKYDKDIAIVVWVERTEKDYSERSRVGCQVWGTDQDSSMVARHIGKILFQATLNIMGQIVASLKKLRIAVPSQKEFEDAITIDKISKDVLKRQN